MSASPNHEPAGNRVISPFSDAESPSPARRKTSHLPLWITLGLIGLIVVAVAGLGAFRYVNDPFRTLEPFPVAKYLEGYRALAGSKFRGNLRVENDLGWKEGVGRLMVFSDKDNPHPVVVMIPPEFAPIYFTKGQTYEAELEVKEGGLIYANLIRKN